MAVDRCQAGPHDMGPLGNCRMSQIADARGGVVWHGEGG
jgi:hypothetical protein